MIKRLNYKQFMNILEFISRTQDKYREFYITKIKDRIYIDNSNIIKRIIKSQEIYGLFDVNLKGLIMIYKEKGYRSYLKILSENIEIAKNLIKYIIWNFSNQDLYIKLKKENPLIKIMQQYGWNYRGNRDQEVLLCRPKTFKRNIGVKENDKHNSEDQKSNR